MKAAENIAAQNMAKPISSNASQFSHPLPVLPDAAYSRQEKIGSDRILNQSITAPECCDADKRCRCLKYTDA
jgi:hypothetical protein